RDHPRLLHADAGADAAGHPGHRLRAARRPVDRRGAGPGGLRRGLRRRAVRAPAARGAVARHEGRGRVQRRPPPGHRRPRLRTVGRRRGRRQPGEGHGGRGGAVHEHRPRAARGHRPHDGRTRAVKLAVYPETLAVVRLGPGAEVPSWAESSSIFSITATASETSIVCAARSVPGKAVAQKPFTAFAVEGPLDFGLTGVLVELLTPLAEEQI